MSTTLARQNLFDFFESRVQSVQQDQGAALSQDVVRYLAWLLSTLGKTEALFRNHQPETLAEMHMRGLSLQNEPQALGHYKHLGDFALYIGGYFSDSLQRKTVGLSYYAEMGGAAYQRAAGISQEAAGGLSSLHTLFSEMASLFPVCLGVLTEVAERDRTEHLTDLAVLLERWLTTRDPHTGRRLAKLGVLPVQPIDD
jgi:hypothetical protein